MIRKINSRQLLIVLCFLAAVYLFQLCLHSEKNGNLPGKLTQYTPGEVNKIEIMGPSENQISLSLLKEDNIWKVKNSRNKKSYVADADRVKSLISNLNGLKPLRLASNEKSRWKNFNVNDSTGTRVKISCQEKVTADLYIGRFSYTQSPLQAQMARRNPYMRQNPGTMSTYVREADKNRVFAVEGFLSSLVNQDVDAFRDKSILSLVEKENPRQIEFSYPADSSFVLTNHESLWKIGDQEADSAKMAEFLNRIKNLKVRDFAKESPENYTHEIKFTFHDGTTYIMNGAINNDTATIASSQYPENTGLDASCALFKQLFKSKDHFLK